MEITAATCPAELAWLQEKTKKRHKQSQPIIAQEPINGKDKKKKNVFNQDTVNALSELTFFAFRIGVDTETVSVWFCRKSQNLKKKTSGTFSLCCVFSNIYSDLFPHQFVCFLGHFSFSL